MARTLIVKKLDPSAFLPTRAHVSDAGLDLYANKDVFIPHGETLIIETGISIGLPEGTFGKIEDRSSLAAKGLRTGAGVVDKGYEGEIKVVLHNFSNTSHWHGGMERKGYCITKGDRIAQLVVLKCELLEVVEQTSGNINNIEVNNRGQFGFGSSGQ